MNNKPNFEELEIEDAKTMGIGLNKFVKARAERVLIVAKEQEVEKLKLGYRWVKTLKGYVLTRKRA